MTETIKAMLEDPESDRGDINAHIFGYINNLVVAPNKQGLLVCWSCAGLVHSGCRAIDYCGSLDDAMSIDVEELQGWKVYLNEYTNSKGETVFRCVYTKGKDWVMASDMTDIYRAICHARLQALAYKRGL